MNELLAHIFEGVVLFVHLLGVANAVHAILKVRAPQAALGWALALITFPWLAIPLYWVFGRQKFIGYREAEEGKGDALDQLGTKVASALAPFAAEKVPIHRFAALPPTRGNAVDLLVDGAETFPALYEAIDAAQESLVVQFFIVRDDHIGRELRDRLVARARAGVRVYFLYDEVGCHALPKAYGEPLREAGVRFEPFRTTRGKGNRFQLNFRNHRKLLIADGRVALTGGLNVGVEYNGESPRFGAWRDTHARVRGPAVQALQLAFAEDWNWATGELPDLCWAPATAEEPGESVRVIASGPADELDLCSLVFLDTVNRAQERLWIASPYFVPDPAVLSALQLAALRGVKVRILLPDKPDHLLPYLSSFSYYEALSHAGIELYRYTAGFPHQKVLLVDEERAMVGSVNVDYRSFHLNFELALLVRDTGFARKVATMLEADFARARKVDLGELQRRSPLFRAGVRFARLLSPIQ